MLGLETVSGWRHHAGIYGAAGHAQGGVRFHDFKLGSNEFDGYSIGGYWTLYSPVDAYVDTVIQGTFYNQVIAQSTRFVAIDTQGWGFVASTEGGYPFMVKPEWVIEPQIQVIYQTVDLNTTRDIGATVRLRNDDHVIDRLGVCFKYEHDFVQNERFKILTIWFRP